MHKNFVSPERSAQPRKPVGGEIALNARSEPSPGRRTTGFDWSAVRSPLQPFGFSPPHRTRNGSAVTKVHERFRKFSSGILPLLNIPNLLNLLNMLNPKPFPIPHNFRAFRDGSKSRFVFVSAAKAVGFRRDDSLLVTQQASNQIADWLGVNRVSDLPRSQFSWLRVALVSVAQNLPLQSDALVCELRTASFYSTNH